MISVILQHRFWTTVLIGMDAGQSTDFPDVHPGPVTAAKTSPSLTASIWSEADLFEADCRLRAGLLDGESALVAEAMIARNPGADCC